LLSLTGKLLLQGEFHYGRIEIDTAKGKIVGIKKGDFPATPTDYALDEYYIVPGLIDLQLNGGLGYDFTLEPPRIRQVAQALPQWGVTSYLPTFITAPFEKYHEALQIIGLFRRNPEKGAHIIGAHLEGPYLNPKYKGAHLEKWLRPIEVEEMRSLIRQNPYTISLVTLAPELPGAIEMIKMLTDFGIVVSAGHTAATYADAQAAFSAGVRYVTHLFNAMTGLHHRNPGLLGAALSDDRVVTGIIVDGIHLHPTIAKTVYRAKSATKINLVTDAMAGMGMPPARYNLAGLEVEVDEVSARLAGTDTLAGSILTLDNAIKNMVIFSGCTVAEAFEMASLVPAKLLNLDKRKGQLAADYDADIAVFSSDFEVKMTLVNGEILYKK
jgi:N-acetylglucosamine-6-phosphate deacetylase